MDGRHEWLASSRGLALCAIPLPPGEAKIGPDTQEVDHDCDHIPHDDMVVLVARYASTPKASERYSPMRSWIPPAATFKLMPSVMLTSSMSTPFWFCIAVTPRPRPFPFIAAGV